jgi:hypothetical protein
MADEDPFYEPAVTAWFDTSLEHDKSLLVLSAGAIGLLVTLLTTIGVSSATAFILYIAALIAFLISIGAVLFVFRRNKQYLHRVITTKTRENDPLLGLADTIALASFGFGIAFTVIIGIGTAIDSFSLKEHTMSKHGSDPNKGSAVQHSSDATKSFNGAGALQQQNTQTQGTSTTSQGSSSGESGGGGSQQSNSNNKSGQ